MLIGVFVLTLVSAIVQRAIMRRLHRMKISVPGTGLFMAYIVMAYTVMAYVVMAYVARAYAPTACKAVA